MVKSLRIFCGTLAIAPLMALLPLVSQAGGLPVFNQWAVDAGDITVTCPAGFSCEVVSFGDGFTQVQWVDTGDGTTYIQTVITDLGATAPDPTDLDYRDESFVQLGSGNGIMSQQSHVQDDALGVFTNSSSLMIGWANPTPGPGSANVNIDQSFQSDGTAVAGDEFITSFSMEIINDGGGTVQDRSITIDQTAGLGDGVNPSNDEQRFLLERRQGAFTTADGSITLDATSFDASNNPLNGGTVDWVTGDDVMVRWIGQSIDLGAQGQSQFGFEGVTNFTDDEEATTFSQTSTGIIPDGGGGYEAPFDWDTTFGPTAPQL